MEKRIIFVLIVLLVLLFGMSISFAQGKSKKKSKDEPVELKPPNYANRDYHFGLYLPEGYAVNEHKEGDVLVLEISSGSYEEPWARLSLESLPKGVTDVAGFWQTMKDRDRLMCINTTYERVTSVAQVPAIQARIESLENERYILAILWAWVRDGAGYTLVGYPPQNGKFNSARELARDLIDQFRWMTDEEIEAYERQSVEKSPDQMLPRGRDF